MGSGTQAAEDAQRSKLLADVGAWAGNVSTSVFIVFINKLLMKTFGYHFATTLVRRHCRRRLPAATAPPQLFTRRRAAASHRPRCTSWSALWPSGSPRRRARSRRPPCLSTVRAHRAAAQRLSHVAWSGAACRCRPPRTCTHLPARRRPDAVHRDCGRVHPHAQPVAHAQHRQLLPGAGGRAAARRGRAVGGAWQIEALHGGGAPAC